MTSSVRGLKLKAEAIAEPLYPLSAVVLEEPEVAPAPSAPSSSELVVPIPEMAMVVVPLNTAQEIPPLPPAAAPPNPPSAP